MRYEALTLERLKEVLHYDEHTGVFTWLQRPAHNSRKKIGDEAGSLKPSGYRYIGIDGRTYLASQLAWFYSYGEWARGQVGVRDGNPSNLALSNLHNRSITPGGVHDYETREGRAKYRRAHKEANPGEHRAYGWRRYYGIGAEEYQKMFLAQGGNCAICKKPERAKSPSGETKWLSVDHDHKTNAVRALLCSSCNHTLGHVYDDPDLLQAAADYLRHHKEKVS